MPSPFCAISNLCDLESLKCSIFSSQVILAKVLCWDLSELRYLKLNARKGNKVGLKTNKREDKSSGIAT